MTITIRERSLLVAVLVLMAVPTSLYGQQEEGTADRFRNPAGNPIMAGDLERVGQGARASDTAPWVEGHRWEPARSDRIYRGQLSQQRPAKQSRTNLPPSVRWFLLTVLTGFLLLRLMLGIVVYRDLQSSPRPASPLWVPIVLIGGTLAVSAYALFRNDTAP